MEVITMTLNYLFHCDDTVLIKTLKPSQKASSTLYAQNYQTLWDSEKEAEQTVSADVCKAKSTVLTSRCHFP